MDRPWTSWSVVIVNSLLCSSLESAGMLSRADRKIDWCWLEKDRGIRGPRCAPFLFLYRALSQETASPSSSFSFVAKEEHVPGLHQV